MSLRRACILGWPLSHSRSPLIHSYWLKSFGLAGEYFALPIPPAGIERALAGFATSGFIGGNVTIPYKEAALKAVAAADPVAAALGAVNTLWLEEGRLMGANTDAAGFLANLDESAPGWDAEPGPAIVLGAGGAARAVVWALLDRGFDPVSVVNRTVERAEELSARFGPRTRAFDWASLPRLLGDARLLVNTTSLGMEGQPPLEIDLHQLSEAAVVTDLVYAPLETPLLAAARARDLPAVDGLGMLLHQAAPGFERWFGHRPSVTAELRRLVIDDLQGR